MVILTYWTEVKIGGQGPTGDDGSNQDKGTWSSGITIYEHDKYTHARSGHGKSVYRAKSTHTSSATNEPEVGVDKDTYWELWTEGGVDGAGQGDITGPESSIQGNFASYIDTGGKEVEDSGVHKSEIAFAGLTESTADLDAEDDYVKVYVNSLGAYRKVPAGKFERKAQTISLAGQGIWKRNTISPCGTPTNKDLPTTRRYLPVVPFGSTAKTYAECSFVMPESWDRGALYAIFYGTTPTATAGGIRMGLKMGCAGDGDSLDVADGTAREVTLTTHSAAYKLIISDPTAAITPSGTPAAGEKLMVTIYRDPTQTTKDTLDEDFYLTDVLLKYGVRDD